MPRPRNYAAHVSAAVQDLLASVTRLVEEAQRAVADGAGSARSARVSKARGGRTPKAAKISRAVRASWANYTPAEHAARVRKMLAGRGLKPKRATKVRSASTKKRRTTTASVRKAAAPRRVAAARRPRANPWAKLSPAGRAARVARMRAGRVSKAAPRLPAPATTSA